MRATQVRSTMAEVVEQARRASSVVAVESQVELCELVKYCNDIGQRIRTTAFGRVDERDARRDALQVDLSGLNRWVEKHDDDMDLRVECGVTRENLFEKLPETGLFFPMANRRNLSIGDVVNANIPNPGSAKYNSPRTNVLGLTVVSATGELFRTGTRARKSSAGYDLTRLYLGSMGKLGIVTEICVRLYSYPSSIKHQRYLFKSAEDAIELSSGLISSGLRPAQTSLVTKLGNADLPWELDLEFHGPNSDEEASIARELADKGQPVKGQTPPLDDGALTHASVPITAIADTLTKFRIFDPSASIGVEVAEGFISAQLKSWEVRREFENIVAESGGVCFHRERSLQVCKSPGFSKFLLDH